MPAATTSDPAAGALLAGRYRVAVAIGEGAMGTVWRAEDLQTCAPVAIKVLLPHVAADVQLRARFEREIAVGRQLAHPHVLPVLDDGEDPSLGRYMVMPLLGGSDLRTVIGGGLGLRRAVALAEQLLAALGHVHACGLVHRDVKPENLRLVDDGRGGEQLLLLDFGLVKPIGAVCRERRLTEAGRVFGTPWYMAPEQAVGGRIDHRVDLYAVGAVLYEMLCGVPPFEGTLVQVLYHQVHTQPAPLPGWVPPQVARVIMGLLSKRPAARPAHAADVAAALHRAALGVASQPTRADVLELGAIATPARPTASMLRGSRPHGRVLGALVAGAIAAAAWFVVAQPAVVETPVVATIEKVAVAPVAVAPVAVAPVAVAPVAVAPVAVAPMVPQPIVPIVPATIVPEIVAPAAPLAPSSAALAAVVSPPAVAPREPARASATDIPRKPAVRRAISRPTSRVEATPEPSPIRTLVATKPPRGVSKLPGATELPSIPRDGRGQIHLRPQS